MPSISSSEPTVFPRTNEKAILEAAGEESPLVAFHLRVLGFSTKIPLRYCYIDVL